MSPEQGRGNETDHRSDIYSLGASLFHLIAGRPPFMGDSPVGTIVQQITQPPPKLIDVVPGIPRRLSDLAARCLEKDPARRYQSYDELLQAIDEAIPRKITPAGAYARLSALLFDLVLVALVLILPWPGDMARVVFYAAYFILLESLLGFTPGKKVLKLAIRKMDGRRALPARIGLRFILAHWFVFAAIGIMLLLVGEKPQDWRAFLQEKQAIAMLLAVLALLYVLGLVSTIFSRQKQALHDSLSGTIVMYDIP
jgi:uncharacterized RDD family membrane protein YckC